MGDAAPETIWQYGDKIPTIFSLNSENDFPKENKFGLISTQSLTEEDLSLIQSYFNIKKEDHFDLNESEKDSRQYKDRLTFDYYILTKK